MLIPLRLISLRKTVKRRKHASLLRVALIGALLLIPGALVVDFINPSTASATAGIEQELSFEGKIVTSAGLNIPDGSYNMEFKIYTGCTNNTGTGCTAVWTEDWLVGSSPVTFTSGTFQAALGSVTAFGTSVPWGTYPLYLSMQIGSTTSCTPAGNFQANCGGDNVMSPYLLLTSTPYAFNSSELNGIASSGYVQTAPTASQIIQPSTNVSSLLVDQNNSGSFGQDVFDVQGSSGGTNNFIQVSSTAANQGAVTIQSLGSSNALSLQSGGGVNIDTGGNADTVQIGNTSGAVAQTVSIGTNATSGATNTINLGTATSGSTTTVNVGSTTTGSYVYIPATHTYVGNTSVCTLGKFCVGQNAASQSGATPITNSNVSELTGTSTGTNTLEAQSYTLQDTSTGGTNTIEGLNINSTGTTNASTTIDSIIAGTLSASPGYLLDLQSGSNGVFTVDNRGESAINWETGDVAATLTVGSSTSGDNEIGLQANSYSSAAVLGTSNSSTGVSGHSTSGTGLYGVSSSGNGVVGASTTGISGYFQSASSSDTSPTLDAQAISGQTADVFQVDSSGAPIFFKVSATGLATASDGLAVSGGAVTLSGNTTSNLTTSSGALTLTSATAATWGTSAGNLTLNSGGSVNIENSTNSSTAFALQNSTGNFVLSGGTTTANILTNSSFDSNILNWSSKGTTSSFLLDTSTSNEYTGLGSLKATASAVSSGMQTSAFTTSILASTQYQVTFYAKCSSSITTFTYGRQDVSGTDINATTAGTCNTNWQQYTFHYTTGATITSPNIYMNSGTTSSVSMWVDAVSLVQTTTNAATNYQPGTIYLNGVIASPVTLENAANSTTAFQVQNASGYNVLGADTTDGWAVLGAASNVTGAELFNNASNANTLELLSGATSASYSLTLPTAGASSSGLCLQSGTGSTSTATNVTFGSCSGTASTLQQSYAASNSAAPTITLSNASNPAFTIQNSNSSPITGNLFSVNANTASGLGTSLFAVTNTGATTLQTTTNSNTALQALNSDSEDILGVGTAAPYNYVLDSNFANGSGSTLTDWTKVGSPTTYTQNTAALNIYEVGTSLEEVLNTANQGFETTAAGVGLTSQPTTNNSADEYYTVSFEVEQTAGTAQPASDFTVTGVTAAGNQTCTGVNLTTGLATTALSTAGFEKIYCTLAFTSGTASTISQIEIQDSANSGTLYFDALDLQLAMSLSASATPSAFEEGTLQLQGVVINPVALQNNANSTTAFQVENAAGANYLDVDTLDNAVLLGANTDLTLQGATAYISNTQGWTNSEAFGAGASVQAADSVSVGEGSQGLDIGDTSVGQGSDTYGNYATAIGSNDTFNNAYATSYSTSVGSGAASDGSYATSIGEGSIAYTNSIALGASASATYTSSIALGLQATTTAANQLVVGGNYSSGTGGYISNVYIGSGVTDIAPVSTAIQGTGSGAAGTAAAALTLAGGAGYASSTGSAGGNLTLQGGSAGGSGVNAGGNVLIQGGVATSTGAGGTVTVKSQTNSTTAFQVMSSTSVSELSVDTTNNCIGIDGACNGNANGLYVPWITGDSSGQAAIYGGSTNGSDASAGILGQSGSGVAVQAYSNSGYGIQANSYSGVSAYFQAGNASNANATVFVQGASGQVASNLIQTETYGGANLFSVNSSTGTDVQSGNGNATTAFQVQNSVGTSIFDVDTTSTDGNGATVNYLTYPGFEVPNAGVPMGWSTVVGGTLTQNATRKYAYNGQFSAKDILGATNEGISTTSFTTTPPDVTYIISFEAMATAGSITPASFTLKVNASTSQSCTPVGATNLSATGFTQVYCTLASAPSGTITGLQITTSAASGTLYFDGVQMQPSTTFNGSNTVTVPTAYQVGGIQLRGVIENPVAIENGADSTSSLQVVNAEGSDTVFNVDTLNSTVSLASVSTSAALETLTNNTATTNNIETITGNALTTGNALGITSTETTALTTGALINVTANSATTATGGLVQINGNALTTGLGLSIVSTSSTLTTGALAKFVDNSATTATGGLVQINGNALTTGLGLSIVSTSAAISTGALASFTDNSDTTTATTGLVQINATSLTGGVALNINASALTNGAAISINSGVGDAILFANSDVLDLASGTATNATVFKLPTAASCTSGTAQGLVFKNSGGTQVGHICSTSSAATFFASAFTASSTDVAEDYNDVNNNLTPGELVAMDPSGSTDDIVAATQANQSLLMGVVSTSPGIELTGQQDSESSSPMANPKPVALSGRIPTQVSTENGSIAVGDPLTVSSIPGVAMKATASGYIIGRALEAYDSTGIGTIEVFAQNSFNLVNSTTSDDLTVTGTLYANGGIESMGPADFYGESTFYKLVTFVDQAVFNQDVTFNGRTTFNNDTGGFAVIHKGQSQVQVTFTTPYASNPVVSVSDNDGQFTSYSYKNLSTTGFTIVIPQPAAQDINFSWTALSITNATTFQQSVSGSSSTSGNDTSGTTTSSP
jgi:hypothetical protein